MQKGQVVYSKAGRDKGLPFVVVAFNDAFVFLADGKLRPLAKPKKKKLIHVQISGVVLKEIQLGLEGKQYLDDAALRKALKPYRR